MSACFGGRFFNREIEADENLLPVGQVTNDTAQGRRQFPHQRWSCQNPFIFGQLRSLKDVNDVKLAETSQITLADFADTNDRLFCARRTPGDIELEDVMSHLGTFPVIVSTEAT